MKYLLDTHIFLWWLNGDKRLRTSIKDIITNPRNSVFISVISAWEISIKLATSPKFILKTSIKKAFEIAGFPVLDITLEHVLAQHVLPFLHKDPFDRMLVAQAKAEEYILITDDPKIKKYRVKTI